MAAPRDHRRVRYGAAINGTVDAYFNWSGFFSLGAAIIRMTGLESLLGVARWAPLWINGLWLAWPACRCGCSPAIAGGSGSACGCSAWRTGSTRTTSHRRPSPSSSISWSSAWFCGAAGRCARTVMGAMVRLPIFEAVAGWWKARLRAARRRRGSGAVSSWSPSCWAPRPSSAINSRRSSWCCPSALVVMGRSWTCRLPVVLGSCCWRGWPPEPARISLVTPSSRSPWRNPPGRT